MNSTLKRTLLSVVTLSVGALCAEGCLRVLSPVSESTTMTAHEVEATMGRGFRYDPDLAWYWKELPEPGADVNEFGFRRLKQMDEKPPEGTTRLIALGDSQAFGGGVRTEESFPYIAEQELGDDWEIVNGGLSGYRSLNIYRLLRLRLHHFEPDILLIDCMPKDSPREFRPLEGTPLGGDRLGEWKWKSRLYYFSQLMLRVVGLRSWESLPWPLQLHNIREGDEQAGEASYRDNPNLGNLDLIGHWAREQGIQTVFMTYAYKESPDRVGCHTWEGALPEGFPVFDACAALNDAEPPAEALFLDKNHFSPEGNRVVGQALAQFLREELKAGTPKD